MPNERYSIVLEVEVPDTFTATRCAAAAANAVDDLMHTPACVVLHVRRKDAPPPEPRRIE